MADENLAIQLGAACSRSAVPTEVHERLQGAFPGCKLIRLSFGLQNKVMVSITVDLQGSGATHASYVPIHPTAAAAAVLQNQPIVVVREAKRSPLWDQEDLYQREGCTSLSVVSMPFYWPPRTGTMYEGHQLPVPQNTAYHPTFGALTVAGSQTTTQVEMGRLSDLALRTGRHVGPHISMLLASLEGAGLLPTEAEAQDELQLGDADEGDWMEDDDMGELFGFDAAATAADEAVAALMPGLAPQQAQQAGQQAQQAPPCAQQAAAGAAQPASHGSGSGSHPSGSGSGPTGHGGMRLRRGMSPFKFSSLTFHPAQLERAFAMHHSRRQQKNDLLAAFVVLLGLLCAAALHMQAQWPAGLAALLLFAPYFFDARLYQGLREPLLGTTQLLYCLFLSSLQPLAPPASPAVQQPLGACPSPSSGDLGNGSCGPDSLSQGGEAVLAGFGILRFVVHSCGLHYVTLSPLLLRLRTNHALPVQFASLCLALFRLPDAYEATLGRVDTVHLMLLGLILIVFSLAALWALWLAELRMRDAWLERRRRRGAAAIDNNLDNGNSSGVSPGSPVGGHDQEPAAAAAGGEGPSSAAAAAAAATVVVEGAAAEAR
ncbi:ABC transporter permease isoform A [Chlorella sorokiniana]|uniref:ABC transporter permease isoform A n=1 Tax=Chlorella sorokiniana TaxID=3076 RepID=A0A2P6TGY7_CHLSO|nr:ABC transporter permease isoform A [Chlorella sorokiniana]|eukprot:PRW33558.1 ABC transporter permease isoform A [Chlorella sorokiniana]